MNTEDIQASLDKLVAAMLAKAMKTPEAYVMMKANQQTSLSVDWKSQREAKIGADHAYEFFRGDDLPTMFDKADAWVAARPDPEQARMQEFTEALAGVIELGHANGIDVQFVNPLTEAMKRLSENALTHQVSA